MNRRATLAVLLTVLGVIGPTLALFAWIGPEASFAERTSGPSGFVQLTALISLATASLICGLVAGQLYRRQSLGVLEEVLRQLGSAVPHRKKHA
jgi:hypothetical protein